MKIKHYKAPDMRTALRQVKDAQGPDAVILSSRRIAGGVEVVAAIDYDGEEAMTEQLAQTAAPVADGRRNVSYGAASQENSWVASLDRVPTAAPAPASRYAAAEERSQYAATDRAAQGNQYAAANDRGTQGNQYAAANERGTQGNQYAGANERRTQGNQYAGANERRTQGNQYAGANDRGTQGNQYAGASERVAQGQYAAASEREQQAGRYATGSDRGRNVSYGGASQIAGFTEQASDLASFGLADANSDVNEELRSLRRMLENQLATLAWNDLARRSPIQTELLKQLTQLGLAQDLATEIVTQLPTRLELAEAHRLALALLARRIEATGERWMDGGGVVSLVGATGVGKTTLIAKLAARWVLRHGPRDIALVSTDSVRIGAQEQIHTLGRLLGVPAYAIDGAEEVAGALEHLQDKRLVLIDTAGLSPRDPRLEQELATLAAASKRMETTLVLSAAAQAGAIEEAVTRFAAAQPTTCMLTKLDEATSLGGAISTLIRSQLPVTYVSEGQRVPEDLAPARAHQLIARAVDLSRKSGASADEDLLRRRFGTVAHAIA